MAAERFGVPVEWLMEAAGWQLARWVPAGAVVVCGVGNNGGDGFAAARHLHRWGRLLRVCCLDPSAPKGPAAAELSALRLLRVEVYGRLELDGAATVVDALLGTGINRAPAGTCAEWIEAINASGLPVVSADIPSGLDADTGTAYPACVRATTTVTFGLPKPGLFTADGPAHSGDVFVADIGIPAGAYEAAGVEAPKDLFAERDCVRL